MLKICKDLFNDWNKLGIIYCHWKSNEHLEEGLDGKTDLDIYVKPDDKNKCEAELKKYGYIKFQPQESAIYPLVDEWLGFDCETGNLVHIHLHYQIITGTKFNKEYVFPIDELIIETRKLNDKYGVYVTAEELELIILYARIVLKAPDKKNIEPNENDLAEIDYLKKNLDIIQLKWLCNKTIGENGIVFFDYIVKDFLNKNEWFALYKIAESWLSDYRKYSKLHVKLRRSYYKNRIIFMTIINRKFDGCKIVKKTLPYKGLAICFIGADGSGKSTISMDISKWMSWKIENKRFYLGSGDHYNSITKRFLNKIRLMRKAKKNDELVPKSNLDNHSDKKAQDKENKKTESFIHRMLKNTLEIIECYYLKDIAVRSYKEIQKAQKYIKNGGIALFDRFPQNQFEGMYDGPKISCRYLSKSVRRPIIGLLAKKEENAIRDAQKKLPNVIFKLILPPEESIRRKPDHTMEEVAPKARVTKLLKFPGVTVYDIDATKEYQEEVLEIKRIIWSEMLKNGSRV